MKHAHTHTRTCDAMHACGWISIFWRCICLSSAGTNEMRSTSNAWLIFLPSFARSFWTTIYPSIPYQWWPRPSFLISWILFRKKPLFSFLGAGKEIYWIRWEGKEEGIKRNDGGNEKRRLGHSSRKGFFEKKGEEMGNEMVAAAAVVRRKILFIFVSLGYLWMPIERERERDR